MSGVAATPDPAARQPARQTGGLFSNEDWWSIWIGLILIAVAYGLFASGTSIKWLAVSPARWTSAGQAWSDFSAHAGNYLALFAVFAGLFSLGVARLGQRVAHFLPSFLILFVASIVIYYGGLWTSSVKYNLEPPLVALALGLIVSNVFTLPEWFLAGLRVEFYIKVGIILLGATLPFTLLVWAGPVALGQATIVSLATFFTIFLVARALGVDPRFAAVLGVAVAVFLAYALRLHATPATSLAVRIAGMGYAIPGTVLAIGVLLPFAAFDHTIDRWAKATLGMSPGLILSGTLVAVTFAYLVRFLTGSLNAVEASLGKITRSMDHAARSLGRGPGSTLWNVHLPIMRGSLLTAGILVFVDVLKELPATLVLRPFNFDTLAVATYNLASDERLAEAAGPALAIVVVGVLPVIMLSRAIGRSRPGTGGAVEGAVP